MTDFEKMMKEMAQKAINNVEGRDEKNINDELSESEIAEAVAGLIGGLFSNAMVMVDGLEKEPMKQSVKKEEPKREVKVNTAKTKVNGVKNKAPLSKVLLNIKNSLGTLGLDKLNKENLTELLVEEKLSVEYVARLFDVQKQLVEYAIITHNISLPKEKDLLEERLMHVAGLNQSELSDYFHTRIDLINSIKEERLKEILTKEFIVGLADLGYTLGMTSSDKQLMLVKRDKKLIYMHVYDLTVDELLKNYDLSKIEWSLK